MDADRRQKGRRAARDMVHTVEREVEAFLTHLWIEDVEAFMDKPKETLGVLDDWFAENYDEAWTPERKAELFKGMGYVCAMVYQEAVIPFGLGWVFVEPQGEILLGPGIRETKDGYGVWYADPFGEAERAWDHEITSGGIKRFFGNQVPYGLADSYNRVAVDVARNAGEWIPPMFYINGIEYDDEAENGP